MAVANTLSTAVTNADATPSVHNNPYISNGPVKTSVGVVAVASGDDDGSVFRIGRISSSDRVVSLRVACTALTIGTSYKAGVKHTAANGGAVVVTYSDQIFMPAGTDLSSAITVPTEKYRPAILNASASVANMELRVWELLGKTADPYEVYDLVLTGVTVGSASGTIAVIYDTVK